MFRLLPISCESTGATRYVKRATVLSIYLFPVCDNFSAENAAGFKHRGPNGNCDVSVSLIAC